MEMFPYIVIRQVVSIKLLSKTSLQPVGRSERILRCIRDIDKVLESGYFLQIRYRHHVLCLWGVGRAFVGHQWEVLAQDIVYLVEGECSGEEHFCLVVGGAVDVARQF